MSKLLAALIVAAFSFGAVAADAPAKKDAAAKPAAAASGAKAADKADQPATPAKKEEAKK